MRNFRIIGRNNPTFKKRKRVTRKKKLDNPKTRKVPIEFNRYKLQNLPKDLGRRILNLKKRYPNSKEHGMKLTVSQIAKLKNAKKIEIYVIIDLCENLKHLEKYNTALTTKLKVRCKKDKYFMLFNNLFDVIKSNEKIDVPGEKLGSLKDCIVIKVLYRINKAKAQEAHCIPEIKSHFNDKVKKSLPISHYVKYYLCNEFVSSNTK